MTTMTATGNTTGTITADELKQRIICALIEHELWEQGWKARVGSALRQLGSCKFGTKTITVSLPLANLYGEEHLEDTILHEIAHAIAGVRAGHGEQWKRVCREIGANPDRLANVPPELRAQTYKWEVRCPECAVSRVGYKTQKARRRGKFWCKHCLDNRKVGVEIEYRSISNPENGWNKFHKVG